jgi:hypothetical protein
MRRHVGLASAPRSLLLHLRGATEALVPPKYSS